MTPEEYKENHIPHRVNLLITYRERFSDLNIDREQVRDFHRCSKDIAMLMVRFFLDEMGLKLKRGHYEIIDGKVYNYAKKITLDSIKNDVNYNDIVKVLTAANRAVAHLIEKDVNHSMKTDPDDQILFNAIDYTVEKIKTHIYQNESEYESAMNICSNKMYRERLILKLKP
jgi:hypothetical protein